ncbi:MAG: ABC transporter ATP-binding protein [Paenibacillus macerans]|uniref:ABC transporter family protein n=1 Tax=Paenibacillus macerans TaxID=44252 RepID=A0A090YC57_PAEMA|nr:ABC transporter ATP-binding protein [Paenibacillus macerans]KFM95427.1 ABC transporter family protein [Paenibacillus macerans]MBS5912748.1 ABC transporter ATP-binding protein [Paenibacillus macerans]MCY7562421.1 ABC transporter ATP-binding protein [Paenibacillus macerans]MDU7474492.1 ABC transporter ATP-binding protein [Paenibacillus macerans]MEC0135344.1 ABC transporter ATP-binding protein [Paenibacillus macerans]
MNSIIEMKQVTWQREGKTILNGVDWTIGEGEHWALLGLNGSGKTTLLNMISGYLWPSSGTISVLGHRFGEVDLRELRKSIGWVSSSLQEKLHGGQKAEDLVVSGKYASIGLYDKPGAEDYDRAAALMEQLRCRHLQGRAYQTCSQGEQQKLLIARALMASPKLLILDEAANGLDFISKEGLLESIAQLAAEPQAPHMLYVTHHTEEILPIFSKTLLLRRGEVFKQGNSREVLTEPLLSDFFEIPVSLSWNQERAWLSRK